ERDEVEGRQAFAEDHGHHTAEPEDQRGQRDVPDRKHPTIIISGLQDIPMAGLEQIADRVVEAVVRDDAIDAIALTFLLRRYRQTDTEPLRRALEPALARGLETRRAASTCRERAAWLCLFTEAASISADDRLREAIADLEPALRAEELVQFARRRLWDDEQAAFRESPDAVTESRPFALNCDAVRVLCRLAALHHDDDYRHVAVVAADANYKADAERILMAHAA